MNHFDKRRSTHHAMLCIYIHTHTHNHIESQNHGFPTGFDETFQKITKKTNRFNQKRKSLEQKSIQQIYIFPFFAIYYYYYYDYFAITRRTPRRTFNQCRYLKSLIHYLLAKIGLKVKLNFQEK